MSYDDAQFGIIESIDLNPYMDARLATTAASALKRMYGLSEYGPIEIVQISLRVGTIWAKASALTVTMHVDGVDRATIVPATPTVANAVHSKACEVSCGKASMFGFDYGGLPNDAAVVLSMHYRRLNDNSNWIDKD